MGAVNLIFEEWNYSIEDYIYGELIGMIIKYSDRKEISDFKIQVVKIQIID
jgi:hypothetical protein